MKRGWCCATSGLAAARAHAESMIVARLPCLPLWWRYHLRPALRTPVAGCGWRTLLLWGSAPAVVRLARLRRILRGGAAGAGRGAAAGAAAESVRLLCRRLRAKHAPPALGGPVLRHHPDRVDPQPETAGAGNLGLPAGYAALFWRSRCRWYCAPCPGRSPPRSTWRLTRRCSPCSCPTWRWRRSCRVCRGGAARLGDGGDSLGAAEIGACALWACREWGGCCWSTRRWSWRPGAAGCGAGIRDAV